MGDLGCCSAIGEHSLVVHGSQPCEADWDIQVLDLEMSAQHRKLREAYWIDKCKAKLNRGVGIRCIGKDVNLKSVTFGVVGTRIVPNGSVMGVKRKPGTFLRSGVGCQAQPATTGAQL